MQRRTLGMLALAVAATAAVFMLPAIPQSPDYHRFADQRTLLGIANALNVVSNAPFLLAGLLGLAACRRAPAQRLEFALFFAAAALVALGSAYYHLAPDNERLVWDRLPMTVGFMSLLAAVIGERVDAAWGRRLLAPLLLVGVGSVLYWIASEHAGRGDLRPYALVQFLSLTLIVYLLAATRGARRDGRAYWVAIGWYALAKLCEHLDASIHAGTGELVSGHSLKHLAASLGFFRLATMIDRRGSATRAGPR